MAFSERHLRLFSVSNPRPRVTAPTTASPWGVELSVIAVWTYEAPYAAVAAIRDHVAFYPDRVDAIEERPESYPPQQQAGR